MWEPSEDFAGLWAKICTVQPSSGALMEALAIQLEADDPEAWRTAGLSENRGRRDSYLLRFGMPLAELTGWPQVIHPQLIDGLALHFWWGDCWRRLDDLLDEVPVTPFKISSAAHAIMRATRLHQKHSCKTGAKWSDEASNLIQLLCATALEEKQHPISRDQIWRRATPFLIIPRTVFELSAEIELAYCSYINAYGLVHDIHDVLSDIKLGIRSLPDAWFSEISVDRTFKRDVVIGWFDKVAIELGEAVAAAQLTLRSKDSIMRVFLDELDDHCASLGPYSSPP
jgi:hypothetical protein